MIIQYLPEKFQRNSVSNKGGPLTITPGLSKGGPVFAPYRSSGAEKIAGALQSHVNTAAGRFCQKRHLEVKVEDAISANCW